MQIRISDMLDNASELIEESSEAGYSVNNDRIKKIVFSEIGCMLIFTKRKKDNLEKDKENSMKKKIWKAIKTIVLILLGLAAALMVWNFFLSLIHI